MMNVRVAESLTTKHESSNEVTQMCVPRYIFPETFTIRLAKRFHDYYSSDLAFLFDSIVIRTYFYLVMNAFHTYLAPSLLVLIVLLHVVHLPQMRLQ